MADDNNNWERSVLERLAFSALKEQRRARRWSIFFKLAGFAYLTVLLVLAFDWTPTSEPGDGHTAMVEIDGVIDTAGNASAENIVDSLQAAFKDRGTKGVILRINSPGGSPVQAGIIYDEIRRLRGEHPDIPIYAVVEDICASGGYYIAAAADRIYVDKASLIGSIGVVMSQFGFVETMDKVGVERRVLTAGENKAFLDPFSPLQPEHVEHAKVMLDEIHQQFITAVKEGRGDRLKDAPGVYSGLIWTGARSLEIGLADALGSVQSVARDVIRAERVSDFTQREGFAERFAKRLGRTMANVLQPLAPQSLSVR
ncbi:MAG TPA: S49 family peptidase [Burkholderiales bacterium]|nr:S49 family peptidase [Burkholderiales bacterium]